MVVFLVGLYKRNGKWYARLLGTNILVHGKNLKYIINKLKKSLLLGFPSSYNIDDFSEDELKEYDIITYVKL